MNLVHLCYPIGGSYGGDDNGYGAAAGQADWDHSYIVECRVTKDATPGGPAGETPDNWPGLEPVRWCHDYGGAKDWRDFVDDDEAPCGDVEVLADELAQAAYLDICGNYKHPHHLEEPGAADIAWRDACDEWERENAPEAQS